MQIPLISSYGTWPKISHISGFWAISGLALVNVTLFFPEKSSQSFWDNIKKLGETWLDHFRPHWSLIWARETYVDFPDGLLKFSVIWNVKNDCHSCSMPLNSVFRARAEISRTKKKMESDMNDIEIQCAKLRKQNETYQKNNKENS